MQHKIYFTPGPSQIFYTVEDHLKSALNEDVMCISHRSANFQAIFAHARAELSKLLNLPEGYDIYFTSSANEVWERIIQNLVEKQSHHFVNGSFSKKFHQFALDYQKSSTATKVEDGGDFKDLSVPDEAELISVTLNETSIGYTFPIEKIKELRAQNPDKLIALDAVSAFPAIPFDLNLVDTAYFSVQKCFGLPAGLGVWIVNQKCHATATNLEAKGHITGSYHSLAQLKAQGDKYQTPETPNILGIYLLGKVAEDMNRRTARQIQNDTSYKAALLYQAISESNSLEPFVESKECRSKTVVVAKVNDGNEAILKSMTEKGWIVGKGYGSYKGDHIRIANFPVHSKEQIEQMADFLTKQ
ncbi:aminotransferase class V-fold PLP-dependent enzyme [Marinoscillum furvescens]|uniref:phosphoserine transaminase n=1 Tax=Marinoscillum furvescens DSM 4134 TaxID=1122208 RepID=A0A3D9KZZ1_MARFU|nr:aminotransferase class V-fold PLP-dependent enzyme [Marinoscillum furvescens]RED96217.1 phosphoserine aminotransferase [Marinoscillum furvescens DSM 4134]